jgi:hypothetical protein
VPVPSTKVFNLEKEKICVMIKKRAKYYERIIMADIKDVINNIEQIYGSNNSLGLLKDFERVIDELDTYVYDNWIDGELVEGPIESRYFVECTFMWPKDKMPEPKGGLRLLEYGCKVQFGEDIEN